jgi:hypothetical protein
VIQREESENFSNLKLPVSALYLLAAPSTKALRGTTVSKEILRRCCSRLVVSDG